MSGEVADDGGALCVLLCLAAPPSAVAQTQAPPPKVPQNNAARSTLYQIALELDFDERSFKGRERVRWVNDDNRPASVLYFHLYANLRGNGGDQPRASLNAPAANGTASPPAADEPRVGVTQVRSARGAPLPFALDEQETVLRVSLREPVAAGGETEIEITFAGVVPEIDPDETSLSAHLVQQLGAALRDTREARRARDLNFRSRGLMLLGTFHPVLAVRDGGEWQRGVRPSVGDWVYTEAADYDVTVNAPADVALFASCNTGGGGAPGGDAPPPRRVAHYFTGRNLRNFALVAGRSLRSAERVVEGVRVRSVWAGEHEKVGRRVLDVAAGAARVFAARFGALPLEAINVVEAPLVAGLGSAEFAGLAVVASAYYLDFDSPSLRNLPEIVREQRASVEDSLEFTVAHMVAHQWWGVTVGSAPDRLPVLDEALAHWSALLYYREAHGPERAAQAGDDQLRGVYEIYRTFGGDDLPADRAAREYRNTFQYAAIVSAKGALMFAALEKLLGPERVFTALRRYHEANRFELAGLDDLRGAFVAEAPVEQRRAVSRTFDRWLSQRHGDEDIAPPNPQLASAVGISAEPGAAKDRNAFSRLGRFFWRQMTRIR